MIDQHQVYGSSSLASHRTHSQVSTRVLEIDEEALAYAGIPPCELFRRAVKFRFISQESAIQRASHSIETQEIPEASKDVPKKQREVCAPTNSQAAEYATKNFLQKADWRIV
jgi:hypothetical protein